MEMFHQIIEQITSAPSTENRFQIEIPEGWGQGRATFGGLIAGILFKAMRVRVEEDRLARALNVSFIGPVSPGPITVEVNTLRNGSSVTQIEARAFQNDEIQCLTVASFGKDRESSLEISAANGPTAPMPLDKAQELPYIPGVTPEFVQQFKMRWAYGGFPFTGNQENIMGGFMQFRDQPAQLKEHAFDETVLVTLIDAWPPVQLSKLKKPSPASSLTWAMEFIQPLPETLNNESWLHYKAEIDHSHNGYGQNHAEIWTEEGQLLAVSRQTVTVFG